VIRSLALTGVFALTTLAHSLALADGDHAGDIAVSAVGGKLTTGGDHFEIHGATGFKIYEADFGDFANGAWVTKNPGFQTQGGATLQPLSLLSFEGLGSLSFWNGSAWGTAPGGVAVSIEDALQDGDNSLTKWTASGVTPGVTSYVDQIATNGTLHSHLALSVTPGAAAGAYAIQLRLTSDAYTSSDPFYLVFNRGLSGEAFESSVESFAAPVPEPSTYALLIAGLFGVAAAARRRQQG
jgi:PEP-CTERM motif